MTSAYLSQSLSLPAYHNPPKSPRTGGILLNPVRSPRHAATYPEYYANSPYLRSPQQLPNYLPSPTASGSYSDVSTDGTGGETPSSASRKIRFAPLPDPRKLDIYIPDNADAQDVQPIVTITPDDADSASLDGSLTNSDDMDTSTICRVSSRDSATIRSSKKGWGKKLLKPFLRSLSPARSSPEDTTTSSLGLFRMSSRDSNSDASPINGRSGSPSRSSQPNRGRRSSTGNAPSPLRTAVDLPSSTGGAPLSATVSDSGSSRPRKHRQRMLNGRVYGSRSLDNPRAADYEEPEFVEWGYGGMGSNSNSHSKYARVQGGSAYGEGEEEEDDGSGMSWVKKRRAQREKERLEKEKKEREEEEERQRQAALTKNEDEPAAVVSNPEGTSTPTVPSSEHHNTTTISIPAPVPRHHHHHKSSVGNVDLTATTMTATDADKTDKPPSINSSSEADSSNTEDKDEEDEDEESNTEEEEEEEEESTQEQNRKTSVCAGVEKISRHHSTEQ